MARETALSSAHSPDTKVLRPFRPDGESCLAKSVCGLLSGQVLPLNLTSVRCRPQREPPAPSLHQQLISLNYPSSPFLPSISPHRPPERGFRPSRLDVSSCCALLCPVQASGNTGASASSPPAIALTRSEICPHSHVCQSECSDAGFFLASPRTASPLTLLSVVERAHLQGQARQGPLLLPAPRLILRPWLGPPETPPTPPSGAFELEGMVEAM